MKTTNGFTLIEMAMVLVVLGLLLGGLLGPLTTQLEQTRRHKADADLEEIRLALSGHALLHGRLPCPADGRDGREARLPDGSCATPPTSHDRTIIGVLPWETLGVGRFDPWGNRYTYAVDPVFTQAASGTPDNRLGRLQVRFGVDATPAVFLSHGPNGPQEQENANHDAIFSLDDPATAGFDDHVLWLSPYLLHHLLRSGARLHKEEQTTPPPERTRPEPASPSSNSRS
ncbi:MAG: prepilin-type N-terminal cleavage/methylation domain-containing protein [Magnetococcales bacterium]|nr:prepilin-type N-terminal cleavage/methylation domain-containing protein [Magnetococcales bacterium]